jgi:hypothetical protein
MNRLDSAARIALSFGSPLGASRSVYPSEKLEAKRQRARAVRERQRAAGKTEIVLVLPKSCVDTLDAEKFRHGLRNRSQVVEQLLTRRSSDQQSP